MKNEKMVDLRAQNALSAISDGVRAGCPVCCARVVQELAPGQRVFFVSGHLVGHTAVCTSGLDRDSLRFGVRPDYEPSGSETRCYQPNHLFLFAPPFDAPAWLPGIPLKDFGKIEEVILEILVTQKTETSTISNADCVELVRVCWASRIPIAESELWEVAAAHGAPSQWKKDFLEKIRFGLECQISINGRKPNGRKRCLPMSRGQYFTKGQLEDRIRLGLPHA